MTYLKTGVYRLSTLSPVHIRAGEPQELYGEGFIRLNDTDDFLYVVDTRKLQSDIFVNLGFDAVNTYTQAFSNPRAKTNVTDVLKQIGYDYASKIEEISKGIVRLPSGSRFMRSGLGQYFIPGSSIKGAMKTAVLYEIVKARIESGGLDLNTFVETRIKKYRAESREDDQRKFKERFAQELLRDAFESVRPRERKRNRRRRTERPGPFTDIFRAIKVKDAIIEETSVDFNRYAKMITDPAGGQMTLKTLSGNIMRLPTNRITTNLQKGDWIEINTVEVEDGEQTVQTYVKADEPTTFSNIKFEEILFTTLSGKQIVKKSVETDTRSECFVGQTSIEISIDHEILKSFTRANANIPFSDLKSLMQVCENFAQAQWGAEQHFLTTHTTSRDIRCDKIETFYTEQKNSATLRVGWGTGMLGTTLWLLLDESVRNKLHNEVTGRESRRFVLENGHPVSPLGWIQLKEE